jgi:hypothetical protein
MDTQHTASQGAAQAFDRERARRKYSWLTGVKRELRSDHGRKVCKQHNVDPHFVAALADDISRIPSFRERGEVWIGQQRIRRGLGVTDRQVRRGLRALKALNLLQIKRRGRGLTNTMAALHRGRPLFPENLGTGSFEAVGNGTRMSSEERTVASSNLVEEEAQEYSSPVGPSRPPTLETPAEEEADGGELKHESTFAQADPGAMKATRQGHSAKQADAFARVLSAYPHPAGQRDNPAYEPFARKIWRTLTGAQKAEATDAAPHAPRKIWLGHWLKDGRETGAFETSKQPAAGPRVWVSTGTRQHAAWTEHYRSSGRRLPTTQHRIDGELRTGWMFESEWPPNFNFVQRDGGAA